MSYSAPFKMEEDYEQMRPAKTGVGAFYQQTGVQQQPQPHPALLLDEDYEQMRRPKMAHGAFLQQSSLQEQQQQQAMLNVRGGHGNGGTSPSKLSVNATEFVPNQNVGMMSNSSNIHSRVIQGAQQYQQLHQQQQNAFFQQNQQSQQLQMQQHQQQQQQQHQQQQQQHRHQQQYDGYQHQNKYHQHQQQQHHHHQQQQQQHQHHASNYQHAQPSTSANNSMSVSRQSVQNRLRIDRTNQNHNAGGNYYQQRHHQPKQFRQNQQHQHHHQQQQQQYFSNSSNSTSAPVSTSSNNASSSSAASHPDMETIALEYLETVIHCLNQNPGQFDSIATRFLTIFDGMENNNYVLSIAMEDIFEKSIENPNFRYMGAKLYNLLHMLNLKKDSLFHTLLKCKLDYHQDEVRQFMETNQHNKVRETALFLAELYMQLRGDDCRILLIAENIVYSLMQLLSKESPENMRCICQTLKLAGFDLAVDCAENMTQIIAQLDAINNANPGKYALAANVISLQKNNWGRKVSNSLCDPETAKPPEPPRLSDEPVFYGPDGRELTAEESDFLAGDDAAAGGGFSDDDDGGDDCDLDPEMDEVAEKAYKEFCKQNAAS